MADLTVTAAKVAIVFPESAEIYNVILAAACTEGQALYQTTSGNYNLADASAANTAQARGIALEKGAAGQCVSMVRKGVLAGFTTGAYDDPIYLSSDTAGALADAAGTVTVRVGRVVSLADPALTEALFVDFDWLTVWS